MAIVLQPQGSQQLGGVQANFVGLSTDRIPYSIPEGTIVGVPTDGIKRCRVFFADSITGLGVSVSSVSVKISDEIGNTVSPLPSVQTTEVGKYYIDWDLSTSAAPKRYDIVWSYVVSTGSDPEIAVETLYVISNLARGRFFTRLKGQVDKSLKMLTQSMIGYKEGSLFLGLLGGVQAINSYPPATGMWLDSWPVNYDQLLIDAATLYMLEAQSLHAIDTDVNVTDQGFNLPVDHLTKLSGFMGTLDARINNQLKLFKMDTWMGAGIYLQYWPAGWPVQVLMNTLPVGSLFREIFATPFGS